MAGSNHWPSGQSEGREGSGCAWAPRWRVVPPSRAAQQTKNNTHSQVVADKECPEEGGTPGELDHTSQAREEFEGGEKDQSCQILSDSRRWRHIKLQGIHRISPIKKILNYDCLTAKYINMKCAAR